MTALDFIVPAFQEKENLVPAVQSILESARSRAECSARVVIVDDGSTDGTSAIADHISASNSSVRAVHQANQGIGGAIQTGIREARSEYLVIWPADMRMTPELFSRIVDHLAGADVLVGYREKRVGYSLLMKFNSYLFAKMIQLVCGVSFRDVTWISIYRTALLKDVRLRETGVAIFPEMLLSTCRGGVRFVEVSMEMQPRIHGTASAAKLKTMTRALAGLARLCARFNRFSKKRTTGPQNG